MKSLTLSDCVLGLWRMDSWGNTPQQNLSLIEECLELGIDTLDQANIYGWEPSCEELLGQVFSLAPELREKVQVISKFNICAHDLPEGHAKHYDTTAQNAIHSVELSLSRMGMECLDVLLIHRLDYLMDADEVAATFVKLKEQGKVKHFGVSNFSTSQLALLQSRLDFPLVTNQVELNPLRFDCLGDGTLDQCQELRIRPMAWSPLAGGELFSETPTAQSARVVACLDELAKEVGAKRDQVALAWVRKHPSKPHVVLGSQNVERIKSAVDSEKVELTSEQWYRVWTASTGVEVP